MKRMTCKLLVVIALLMLILPYIPTPTAAAASEVYYGEAYNGLRTEEQRHAYRLVEESIAGLSPVVKFFGVVKIYDHEISEVIRAVCVDNPAYFWFLETGLLRMENEDDPKQVTSFEPEYILDGERIDIGSQELMDAMYAFHTKVRQIIDGIPANYTTDYEIALYLHDYLAENVTYTLEGDHPSAYAAIIHGEAACYGYSKAYQCLLNAAGVRARTVTGVSDNGDGELTGHAWNQVWLDGNCYYVDVTWDDYEAVTIHQYFGMTLAQISRDHFVDEEFVLEDCAHEPLDYHEIDQGCGVGRISGTTTAAEAAAYFQFYEQTGNTAVFVCQIRYTGTNFLMWLDKNGLELCQLLGLSDATTAYYYNASDVYYLQLMDKFYGGNTPTVTDIKLEYDQVDLGGPGARFHLRATVEAESLWTPNLVYESSDPGIAMVDDSGLITAISAGTVQITARSEDGSVRACCTVTVTQPPEHTHTMRLFLKKSATCTQNGHEDYYLCSGCGLRFGDEAGNVAYTKAEDYILPKQHQRLFYFTERGGHVLRCKCGYSMEDTRGAHSDEDGDGICNICNLAVAGSFTQTEKQNTNEKGRTVLTWIVVIAVVVAAVITVVCVIIHRRRWRIG